MSVIVTVTSPLDSYAAEREEQILAAAARGGVRCRTIGEPLQGVRAVGHVKKRWRFLKRRDTEGSPRYSSDIH